MNRAIRIAGAMLLALLLVFNARGQAQREPTSTNTATLNATLFFLENAYNPVPSPDGRFIAYVATGWGDRLPGGAISGGLGRSSLVSDVELADASGKVLFSNFCPRMFLAGWTNDSKAVVCYRDGKYTVKATSGLVVESGDIPGLLSWPFCERVSFTVSSPCHRK